MVQDARVDQQKIAKLKSQGNEAVKRKDFLSAAEAYSMVCHFLACRSSF
jgi:hypothetical protein